MLWTQNIRLPMRATLAFAAALLLSTLAIVIPSLPFRLGLFEYYTLSWFHCTSQAGSAASLALAYRARSSRTRRMLAGVAVMLLVPLARQIARRAARSSAGTIERLDASSRCARCESWRARLRASRAHQSYSLLVWCCHSPSPIARAGVAGARDGRVFFWIAASGCRAAVHAVAHAIFRLVRPVPAVAGAGAGMHRALAGQSARWSCCGLAGPAHGVLAAWAIPALPADTSPATDNFRGLRPILEDLQKACATDPGIVLADNDAGHYIRYYTQCSVIANNFLLTRQHEEKIRQIDYLTSLPASALPGVAPFVRYILLRPVSIVRGREQTRYMSYSQSEAPRSSATCC